MLGKLRVRVSTLQPWRQVEARLPLLADRDKRGIKVAHAHLSLKVKLAVTPCKLCGRTSCCCCKDECIWPVLLLCVSSAVAGCTCKLDDPWLNPVVPTTSCAQTNMWPAVHARLHRPALCSWCTSKA